MYATWRNSFMSKRASRHAGVAKEMVCAEQRPSQRAPGSHEVSMGCTRMCTPFRDARILWLLRSSRRCHTGSPKRHSMMIASLRTSTAVYPDNWFQAYGLDTECAGQPAKTARARPRWDMPRSIPSATWKRTFRLLRKSAWHVDEQLVNARKRKEQGGGSSSVTCCVSS